MAGKMVSGAQIEEESSPGPSLGRCWTICAMLFVASIISYMDCRVIAILKPTIESRCRTVGAPQQTRSWGRTWRITV